MRYEVEKIESLLTAAKLLGWEIEGADWNLNNQNTYDWQLSKNSEYLQITLIYRNNIFYYFLCTRRAQRRIGEEKIDTEYKCDLDSKIEVVMKWIY